MNTAVLYILMSVLGSALAQLLLKKGMNRMGVVTLSLDQLLSITWKMATNPYVLIGFVILVASTVVWLAGLSRVDLSYAYPLASISYVIILLASWIMFDEKITPNRLVGTFLIGIGVLFISRS